MSAFRLRTALLALVLALGLTACGDVNPQDPHVADADNNGDYVQAGPVTYQLQISRELNQYSTEDSEYVKGIAPGTTPPSPTQEWYGVFLWAKNQTKQVQTTSDSFEIVDTQGTTYYPVKINAGVNPFAWTSQALAPLETEPAANTPASEGPTQGGLVLFKIDDTAYANRPLTLYILGAGNQRLGSISLDL